jgi:hypothetical protein
MYPSFFDELEKIANEAKKDEDRKTLMGRAVAARPWVVSAAKGALPTASLAALLPVNPKLDGLTESAAIEHAKNRAGKLKSKLIAGAALLGTAAGVTDRAMKEWAVKHPRSTESKQLAGQFKTDKGEFKKTSAMAGDLRRNGIGGVKEPPFPTEDSKQRAEHQYNMSTKPGQFTNQTQPKHLVRPGPSIHQLATLPT